ncbi:hypothetical protein HaLaN_00590 [Haematococcus lacustris]|uniref:Uncharacterized protein n=1 Tax=Haematococcus lacustris TaxID=44745 RepID=A0A699Y730_HAELA|nr:hypothetical protein HaLaN_00590 [Haematococcus lacustris]
MSNSNSGPNRIGNGRSWSPKSADSNSNSGLLETGPQLCAAVHGQQLKAASSSRLQTAESSRLHVHEQQQ